ncbi:MAG: hypothetical protein RKE49_00960 [Oceanicaulis sp.]
MKTLKVFSVALIGLGAAACHDGSLRALGDAMAMSSGYQIEYHDQRDCTGRSDDILVCTEIYRGSGSYEVKNQTAEYCVGHLYFENGSRSRFELRPYAQISRNLDIYNWTDRWEWTCDSDPRVLDARLEDDGRWHF